MDFDEKLKLIGNRFEKWRTENGISFNQAGKETETSAMQVSNFSAGKNITIKFLLKLKHAYPSLDLTYILTGQNNEEELKTINQSEIIKLRQTNEELRQALVEANNEVTDYMEKNIALKKKINHWQGIFKDLI